jgi:hypothetical protein
VIQIEDLKVGDKIRKTIIKGHRMNRLWHVRGFVDGMVIVRHWGRKPQWYYELLNQFELERKE